MAADYPSPYLLYMMSQAYIVLVRKCIW